MIWVLLQSESPWQRNNAITFFIYFMFLCAGSFFKKSVEGVCTCHNCLNYIKVWTNSMMMEWIWWNINSTDKTDRESTTWKSEIHRVESRIRECLGSTSFPGFYPGERTWERGWCWITQKSSRYVAIVAKFLDDNKPIKSPKSLFALFQTSPILFSFI